jgi:hypothetical protein
MISDQVRQRYSSHVPNVEGIEKMRKVRKAIRILASEIDVLCPEGRDKATALTCIQQAMFHANAAISQGFPIDDAEQ